MDILALMFLLLFLYQGKVKLHGYWEDYLGREQTDATKGIFLVFVFYRHFTSYIDAWGVLDLRILQFNYFLDQLIVVMFLFYSGYGVGEAIRTKGHAYVKRMPMKRILPVLIRFDLTVFLFYLLSLLMHKHYACKRVLLSLTGWQSIGNSNWYIFIILLLYLITFVAAYLTKENRHATWLLVLFVSLALILLLRNHKEVHWYNTLIAYTLGLFYSTYKGALEKLFQRSGFYYIWLILFGAIFVFSHKRAGDFLFYQIMVAAFAFFLVLFTMKISLRNRLICYMGRHLFSLYMLQRIPMIALKKTTIYTERYIYFISCMVLTLLLAYLFDTLTDRQRLQALSGKRKDRKNGF